MKQNNIYRVILSIAKNLNTLTLLLVAVWAFASCTDEDIPGTQSSGKVGTLHISAVNVDAGSVASRSTTTPSFNDVVTKFSEGSVLTLKYDFLPGENNGNTAYAKKTDGGWKLYNELDNGENNPIETTIKPNGVGQTWGNFSMSASFIGTTTEFNEDCTELYEGNLTGTCIYADKLLASGVAGNAKPSSINVGEIGFDPVLTSATLGEVTIKFKHAHALLRLPVSAIKIDLLHKGVRVTNYSAFTFWAELNGNSETIYVPLTLVSLAENNTSVDYLQAIAPVGYELTGFKAVMQDGTTIALSYKVGDATPTDYVLVENTKYNLSSLTLNSTLQQITFYPSTKPGWGGETEYKPYGLKYNPSSSVFEVYTAEGLQLLNQWMNKDSGKSLDGVPGKEFVTNVEDRKSCNINLMNDITFDEDTKTLPGNNNWKILQNYKGTFNGNNHTISGLEMHSSGSGTGFIDQLDGKLINLVIDNANFSAIENGTGILVAQVNTNGRVENCIVKNSKVNGGSGVEDICVGAVVGVNLGNVIASQSINNTVSGYDVVGGVVGKNNGIVVACSNQCTSDKLNTTNTSNPSKGGIAGQNNGTIYGSWTVADTKVVGSGSTTNEVSCFVGFNEGNIGAKDAAPLITMNGGIAVCNANRNNIANWHWENESSSYKLVSEAPALQKTSNDEAFGAVYIAPTSSGDKGTFEVYTAEGLKDLNDWINNQLEAENSQIVNNKDMTQTHDNGVQDNPRASINITLKDDIVLDNSTPNWSFTYHFNGTFDGAGHTITNLYVKSASGSSLSGLFDQVTSGSVVKNLTLKNPKVIEEFQDSGIIVCANHGTISNCHVEGGSMSGKEGGIGGIAGTNSSTGVIENCSVKNVIFSSSSSGTFGAIVGINNSGTVQNCKTEGCKIDTNDLEKLIGNQ